MKTFLCVLLLNWVYLSESKNIDAQEKSSERFNSSNDETDQGFNNLWRHKRSICDNGTYYDKLVGRCCRKCPGGEHVEKPCATTGQDTVCTPCQVGTFLPDINYLTKCKRCTSCLPDIQVEAVRCSATSNAVCVCVKGYYRLGEQDPCQACTKCHNRKIISNCSSTSDTKCGDCLPGFYEEKSECHRCNQSDNLCETTNSSCSPVCERVVSAMPVPYILIGALLLLLLPCVGFLLHKHKKKKKHRKGELIFTVHEGGDVPGLKDTNQETRILTPVLQKSCTLYDIIDCVPVRRWKEFMRTLELPDKIIETVEVEMSNFRDQQYEMLRRWCQLKIACIESVYHTLERMNLSGCAEELKAKIEQYS
ncbi:tumor necrosis factor receptor superfamily member 25 isoform X2 [Engystomops pustulosus]|uniref:tumor necrosis factor receptor superfamily member 25 isoform X2 n=1 Tax=Engystomops pustulosus TaxID=76066 RepID=UPI003AFB515C